MPSLATSDLMEALGDELCAWDGTATQGDLLLAKLREVEYPRRKVEWSAAAAAVNQVVKCVVKNTAPGLKLYQDPATRALARPFFGHPSLLGWGFGGDPTTVDDAEALAWFEAWAPDLRADGALLSLARVLFECRPRRVWVPAARFLGRVAVHQAATAGHLDEQFARFFPVGTPTATKPQWRGGRLSPEQGSETHDRRHLLLALATRFVGGGGGPDGFDPVGLVSAAPPRADSADASAVLLAVRVLADDTTLRAALSTALPGWSATVPASDQVEGALRDLYEALSEHGAPESARSALRDRLVAPPWDQGSELAMPQGLLGLAETLRWLKDRGETDVVAERLARASVERPVLELAVSDDVGDESEAERLVDQMSRLLRAEIRETTTPRARAALAAEAFLLSRRCAVAPLSWPALLARATGRPLALGVSAPRVGELRTLADGTPAALNSGAAELCLELADAGIELGEPLRRLVLDVDDTMRIAGRGEGTLPTVVSVQVERLLREGAPIPEDAGVTPVVRRSYRERQLRLLWRLLQEDPPASTFTKLGDDLRGKNTTLHHLVACVAQMDASRAKLDAAARQGRTADKALLGAPFSTYAAFTRAAAAHLDAGEEGSSGVTRCLEHISVTVLQRATGERGATPADLAWLGRLVGQPGEPGLVSWWSWWNGSGGELWEAWTRFSEHARQSTIDGSRPSVALLVELERDIDVLERHLSRFVWPERTLFKLLLDPWRVAQASQMALAVTRDAEAARWRHAVGSNSEVAALALVDAPGSAPPWHDPSVVSDAHQFLLARGLYTQADRLAETAPGTIKLRRSAEHLRPMMLGAASGAFLVVDQSGEWEKLLDAGQCGPAWLMGGLAMVGSMFIVSLAIEDAEGSFLQRSWTRARRASRPWVRSLGLTALVTLLLSSLFWPERFAGEAPVRQAAHLFLWLSLAQFLGLFLGVIAAGNRLVKRE